MTAGQIAGGSGTAPRSGLRTAAAPLQARAPAAAQPIYFGPVDGRLFGWLHAATPAAAVPPLAVLICAPLGPEDLASHRGLRRLAVALAAAGMPVLRFDHAGWGDSAELPSTAVPSPFDSDAALAAAPPRHDPPTRWLRAIDAAADELRLRTGAPRLALVGLRMGALLAATAACARNDVEALLAILPVESGRAWLRECRLLGAAKLPDRDAANATNGTALEIGGLLFDAAAADAVAALRWPAAAGTPAPHVLAQALLIERDDTPAASPAAAAAAAALQAQGVAVEREPFAGLGRIASVAHAARTPQALIERCAGWLAQRAAVAAAVPLDRPTSAAVAFPTLPVLRAPGCGVVERSVWIGEAPRLFGVLAMPSTQRPQADDTRRPQPAVPAGTARRGLLLLASGAERRIGPHGLWAAFARQRAAAGDVVLRLDLAGIGDSDDRAGTTPETDDPSRPVYDARCVDDIATALAWLRAECGVGRCDVVGLCSGAYHAWRAALAGVALSTVVSVNPVVFHWRDGMSLDPVGHAFGRIAIAADARRSLRDPKRWAKLLRGQVDVAVIAAAVGGRLADRARGWARGAARLARVPLVDDLAAELRAVSGRGVRLCFVFAEGDPGQALLVQGAGRALRPLLRRGQVSLQTIAAADHTFTRSPARRALYRALAPLLDVAALTAPPLLEAANDAWPAARTHP